MKTTTFRLLFSCYGWGFCSPDLFIPRVLLRSLFTRHDLTVGGNPLAVRPQTSNGDGKQDIAVSIWGPTGATTTFVAVFLWKMADGTFTLFFRRAVLTRRAGDWLSPADLNHGQ